MWILAKSHYKALFLKIMPNNYNLTNFIVGIEKPRFYVLNI